MSPEDPLELAVAFRRLCRGRRIDAILAALSEQLARTIAAQSVPEDDVLFIVAALTREWLATGGFRTRLVVRSGEPDLFEGEFEDLDPLAKPH